MELEPGESFTFSRDINANNLITGKYILVRVYLGEEVAFIPLLTKTCRGVNLSVGDLPSSAAAMLIYGISLVGMLVTGLWFTRLERNA
ncbi:MAG: hypothetical protein WA110_10090 [Anaerolineaceae bacterium]